MSGDREAVCLVTNTFDEIALSGVREENDRILRARYEQPLSGFCNFFFLTVRQQFLFERYAWLLDACFCDASDVKSITRDWNAKVFECSQNNRQLTFAAVNQNEVGQVLVFESSLQPARKCFVQHGVVISAAHRLDIVFAIAGFIRFAVYEAYARGHCVGPLKK